MILLYQAAKSSVHAHKSTYIFYYTFKIKKKEKKKKGLCFKFHQIHPVQSETKMKFSVGLSS